MTTLAQQFAHSSHPAAPVLLTKALTLQAEAKVPFLEACIFAQLKATAYSSHS